MCDMPPDLPAVLGLTALIQCLVVELAWEDDSDPGLDECGLMIVRQNRWRAARFGLGAGFIDPRTGHPSSAREVLKDMATRLGGTAKDLARQDREKPGTPGRLSPCPVRVPRPARTCRLSRPPGR